MGHFDNLLGNQQATNLRRKLKHFHMLFHHLQHWDGEARACTSSKPTPQCCPTRPCGTGSFRTPGRFPGGGAFCRRNASCWSAPPPLRPWPSPGAVRYGADSRPGPSRLPSVHAATWNGGVALSGGGHFLCRRLHRHVQPWADR